MGLRSLAEWGLGLAALQTLLTFVPNAGPAAVIARYLIWLVLGIGFLYWVGHAGMTAGLVLGDALRPPT